MSKLGAASRRKDGTARPRDAARGPRAERARVRALASAVCEARLSLARSLGGADEDPARLEARVDALLAAFWRRRFADEGAHEDLSEWLAAQGAAAAAPALEALRRVPPTPASAERLARAHEIVLTRRLGRGPGGWRLLPSRLRRRQASYYTPRDVVDYVVEETVGALLEPLEATLAGASAARREALLERASSLAVLEPACGGGAFLLGALRRLRRFYRALGVPRPGRHALEHNLYGFDLDARALDLAELSLLAAVSDEPGPLVRLRGERLLLGDHLDGPLACRDRYPAPFARPAPGFDAVLGNPPYAPLRGELRDRARCADFATAGDGDLYATFVEGLEALLRPEGRGGLVVPLSLGYSVRLRRARELVLASARAWRLANFDRIPSGLFPAEVRTRSTILLAGPRRPKEPRVASTPLVRFAARERSRLFERLAYASVDGLHHEELGWPRPLSPCQAEWLGRLRSEPLGRLGDAEAPAGPHRLYFKQNSYAFLVVAAELPPAFAPDGAATPQTKYSALRFADADLRDASLALLAGAWGYAWWLTYGDGFDVTRQLLRAFPLDPRRLPPRVLSLLARLGVRIQSAVRGHVAFKRNGGKRIGTFDLRACRSLTHRADELLARALGAEELLSDVRSALSRTHAAG